MKLAIPSNVTRVAASPRYLWTLTKRLLLRRRNFDVFECHWLPRFQLFSVEGDHAGRSAMTWVYVIIGVYVVGYFVAMVLIAEDDGPVALVIALAWPVIAALGVCIALGEWRASRAELAEEKPEPRQPTPGEGSK